MYRNSSIYIVVSIVSVISNFIALPFFTQYLNLSDYGIVALFIMYGSLTAALFSFGLSQALNKFFFKFDIIQFKKIYSSVYFLLIFIFVFLLFLSWILNSYINKFVFPGIDNNKLIILSILNGCIFFLYIVNKELIINQKKPYIHSFLVLIQLILNITISAYLVFFKGYTYLGLIYGLSFANLFTLLISIFLVREYLVFYFDFDKLKQAFYFSYPETPNTIIGLAFKSFDKLMLSNIKGSTSVGAYDLGQRFTSIIKTIQDSIAFVWNPIFMEMAESKSNDALEKLKIFFNEIIVIFGFISICASFFAEEALIILTNPEFYSIKYLIPILAITTYGQILSYLYSNQILFSGKLIYNLPISIFSLGLNIFLNIFMIPAYGVLGAIIATMISKIFNIMISLYFGNRAFPIKIGLKNILFKIMCMIFLILSIYPLMYFINSFFMLLSIKLLIVILLSIYLIYFKFIDPIKIINEIIK